MSTHTKVYLYCDGETSGSPDEPCEEHVTAEDQPDSPATPDALREYAQQDLGWKRVGGRDLCPGCVDSLEQEEEA